VANLSITKGAGVPYAAGNTTDWPLDGGSLELDLHHPWSYVFVNLGLGGNTTNFNVSLTPEFWNTTGKGTLCVEQMPVPEDIADGTLASVQVVTLGESGAALYNCADIRFSKDAKRLANCTSDGVTVATVKEQTGGSNSSNSTDEEGDSNDKDGAASGSFGANFGLLSAAVGLTTVFAMGLGV